MRERAGEGRVHERGSRKGRIAAGLVLAVLLFALSLSRPLREDGGAPREDAAPVAASRGARARTWGPRTDEAPEGDPARSRSAGDDDAEALRSELLRAHEEGGGARQAPGDPVWAPSPASDQPAAVRIENRCARPLALSWIDFDGHEQLYASIRPGRFWDQPTFVGHEWVLRDADDRRVVARFAGADGQVVSPCGAPGDDERAAPPLALEDVPPARCPICSPPSSHPAELDVVNRCARSVQMLWRDFDGQTRPYATLAPGGTVHQASYTGHRWELVDEDGAVVARHVVAEDGEVVIACDGS